MKLASLKNNTRDGKLIIVNQALTHYVEAGEICETMQQALDDWVNISSNLEEKYQKLQNNQLQSKTLNMSDCLSPLPRAYQWADASAYVNHVELVRKARGAQMPESFWHDPLMYQGCSDTFLTPTEDIPFVENSWGLDFEAEIATILLDTPMQTKSSEAEGQIGLIMLVNDVSLRGLIPNELAKGFGFFQSKPASSFSPIAVTPDELGNRWKDGKLSLPLSVHLNDELFGCPNAGMDMTFNFHQLIEHLTKSRNVAAGTILGSGTVSNVDRSKGSCCLAEKRMIEIIEQGEARTPFLKPNDTVRIEMFDDNQLSIFGQINQKVKLILENV